MTNEIDRIKQTLLADAVKGDIAEEECRALGGSSRVGASAVDVKTEHGRDGASAADVKTAHVLDSRGGASAIGVKTAYGLEKFAVEEFVVEMAE